MSDGRVYQMTVGELRPVDVVDVIANEAEDVAALVRTHEAKQHMAIAEKHLRWAAAAERNAEARKEN